MNTAISCTLIFISPDLKSVNISLVLISELVVISSDSSEEECFEAVAILLSSEVASLHETRIHWFGE